MVRRVPLLCVCLVLSGVSACSSNDDGRAQNQRDPVLNDDDVSAEDDDVSAEDDDQNAAEPDAGAAPCGGRAQPLEGLFVEGTEGLTLAMESFSPDPPVVGDNAWVVRIERDAEPFTNATESIVVVPTMPDHGHGTSVNVGIEEEDPGVYRFEPVNTFMAGYWQIDVLIDDPELSGSLRFGVCVE
jgi:hypothetical protein